MITFNYKKTNYFNIGPKDPFPLCQACLIKGKMGTLPEAMRGKKQIELESYKKT